MTENINENIKEYIPEDIRIPSYIDHGWMKLPKTLKEHFDTRWFGVFDVIPPMFTWNATNPKLELVFKWSTDINDKEIPLNENGKPEFCWISSLRSQKYIHPPRDFNKFVREKYPSLCRQQQPIHEWSDDGAVITLNLSWDLNKYVIPKE